LDVNGVETHIGRLSAVLKQDTSQEKEAKRKRNEREKKWKRNGAEQAHSREHTVVGRIATTVIRPNHDRVLRP